MTRPTGSLLKNLFLLPLLGGAAQSSQAAASPPVDASSRLVAEMAQMQPSSMTPALAGGIPAFAQTFEIESPHLMAQVTPMPGTANTQVGYDSLLSQLTKLIAR